MRICPATREDREAIALLLEEAYGRRDAVEAFEANGDEPDVAFTLVAIDRESLIGAVQFVRTAIERDVPQLEDGVATADDGPRGGPIAALAWLAVAPEVQREGVGDALLRDGLQRLRDAGFDAVVAVGRPSYGERFGFGPAAPHGLSWPGPWASESVLAVALRPGGLAARGGRIAPRLRCAP